MRINFQLHKTDVYSRVVIFLKQFSLFSIFFSFLLTSLALGQAYNEDFGDGSNGNCTEATFTTGGTYNCQTVVISSDVNVQGSSPLIIRVLSTVQINAVLSVDGSNGQNGGLTGANVISLGGAGGAGGNSGGNCSLAAADNCATISFNDGDGAGAGTGGTASGAAGGGGGGGGAFQSAGLNGEDGSAGHSGGNGGASYGSATSLKDSPQAGSSGGAAGNGHIPFDEYTGGGGGGSGGILKIVAQGSISISSTGILRANGGDGGAASSPGNSDGGGGGGGGSGGLIHLISASTISNQGTIEARGGSGGPGPTTSGGGDGGAGGLGFILIENPTGTITGTAPSNPTANFFTLQAIPLKTYSGDFSCGGVIRSEADPKEFILAFLLGLVVIAVLARRSLS